MAQPKSNLQAINFDLNYWTAKQIIKWWREHPNRLPIKPVDISGSWARFRITDPAQYKSFSTVARPDHINIIIGYY